MQRPVTRPDYNILGKPKSGGFRWTQWAVGLTSLAVLLIYIAWIGGPYLRSIVVRDAAISTWINVVKSPIEGYFDENPLFPGTRAGPDGRIAKIENPLADAAPVARAEAALALAKERVVGLEATLDTLEAAIDTRAEAADAYASAYKRDIDERITAAISAIAYTEKRLELARIQATRLSKLTGGGHASQAAADVAESAVLDLQHTLTTLKGELERATVRREGAKRGALLTDDGDDGGEVVRSLEDLRLILSRTRLDLAAAKVDVTTAEQVLDKTGATYNKERLFEIVARPGAMVWSLLASPGASVQPGTPVISWIDCSIMLVDVPVSDVELALLSRGAPAEIVIEGEREVRRGTVLLERGAAATMGTTDLAAVAKGRTPGVGQVLVKIDPRPRISRPAL